MQPSARSDGRPKRMNSLRWAAKPAGLTVGFILIILSVIRIGGGESAKDSLVMVPLLCALVCVPTGGLALTVGLFLRVSRQFRVAGVRVAYTVP